MYPTVVIVLVETQRSAADICGISPSNASRLAGPAASDHEARAATLRYPSFAVGPINNAMDNEAGSPPSRVLQTENVQEHGLEKAVLEVHLKESG